MEGQIDDEVFESVLCSQEQTAYSMSVLTKSTVVQKYTSPFLQASMTQYHAGDTTIQACAVQKKKESKKKLQPKGGNLCRLL